MTDIPGGPAPDPSSPLGDAVVAVIGATGGLGGAVARELSGRGARLVLTGRDTARLETLRRELPGSVAVEIDLRDPDAGDALVQAADAAFGHLDVVVNAAGIVAFGPLVDTPDLVIEELFLTNVIGPLWLLRRCLPLLQAAGGLVVQISAVVAEQPQAGLAAYSATKAALSAADRALARELRRVGVRVLDVRPPHTETGLAGRPLHGEAPPLRPGLDPQVVVAAIVAAMEAPKGTELAAADFAGPA